MAGGAGGAGLGEARLGRARQGRRGTAGCGWAGLGLARQGLAGQGRAGEARLDVASAQDNLNAIIEAVARAAEWLDDEVDNQDDAQADQRVGSAGR